MQASEPGGGGSDVATDRGQRGLPAVGARVRSPEREVSDRDLLDFATLTGDWSALHMDEDAAKRGPFGVRIAHGLLTLSIASGLLLRIDRGCFLPACTVGLYGIDRVRYLAPVRIGDRIHVTGEMRAVRPQQRSRVVLTWRCQIVRHDAEVAAVLDLLILCDPEVATR